MNAEQLRECSERSQEKSTEMLLKVVDKIEEVQPAVFSHEFLVRRYRARILRAAVRCTRNLAYAKYVVQQSFQKAFLHLQIEENSSFSIWLTRIAINEAHMWLRRRGSAVETPAEESSAENGAGSAPDPKGNGHPRGRDAQANPQSGVGQGGRDV